MKCKCGFSFAQAYLDKVDILDQFGVVHDKDYSRLMRMESKTLDEKDKQKRLKRILKSSQYVGSLVRCPKCLRLRLLKPEKRYGDCEPEYYVREK